MIAFLQRLLQGKAKTNEGHATNPKDNAITSGCFWLIGIQMRCDGSSHIGLAFSKTANTQDEASGYHLSHTNPCTFDEDWDVVLCSEIRCAWDASASPFAPKRVLEILQDKKLVSERYGSLGCQSCFEWVRRVLLRLATEYPDHWLCSMDEGGMILMRHFVEIFSKWIRDHPPPDRLVECGPSHRLVGPRDPRCFHRTYTPSTQIRLHSRG